MTCLGGNLSKGGNKEQDKRTYNDIVEIFYKEASRTRTKCISEAILIAVTHRTVGTLQEAKPCQERGGSRNPEECKIPHSHGLDPCISFLSQTT
jgi:hypothetical protein